MEGVLANLEPLKSNFPTGSKLYVHFEYFPFSFHNTEYLLFKSQTEVFRAYTKEIEFHLTTINKKSWLSVP